MAGKSQPELERDALLDEAVEEWLSVPEQFMTADRLSSIRERFVLFDTGLSASLSQMELQQLLEKIGHPQTRMQLSMLMKDVGATRNVSYGQFLKLCFNNEFFAEVDDKAAALADQAGSSAVAQERERIMSAYSRSSDQQLARAQDRARTLSAKFNAPLIQKAQASSLPGLAEEAGSAADGAPAAAAAAPAVPTLADKHVQAALAFSSDTLAAANPPEKSAARAQLESVLSSSAAPKSLKAKQERLYTALANAARAGVPQSDAVLSMAVQQCEALAVRISNLETGIAQAARSEEAVSKLSKTIEECETAGEAELDEVKRGRACLRRFGALSEHLHKGIKLRNADHLSKILLRANALGFAWPVVEEAKTVLGDLLLDEDFFDELDDEAPIEEPAAAAAAPAAAAGAAGAAEPISGGEAAAAAAAAAEEEPAAEAAEAAPAAEPEPTSAAAAEAEPASAVVEDAPASPPAAAAAAAAPVAAAAAAAAAAPMVPSHPPARVAAIRAIVDSEQEYSNQLGKLEKVFLRRLRALADTGGEALVLSNEDIDRLFSGTIVRIVEVTQLIVEELIDMDGVGEDPQALFSGVGQTFLKRLSDLQVYKDYYRHYQEHSTLLSLRQMREALPAFDAFVTAQEAQHKLLLEELLEAPTKRIYEYIELLQRLLVETQAVDDPDLAPLTKIESFTYNLAISQLTQLATTLAAGAAEAEDEEDDYGDDDYGDSIGDGMDEEMDPDFDDDFEDAQVAYDPAAQGDAAAEFPAEPDLDAIVEGEEEPSSAAAAADTPPAAPLAEDAGEGAGEAAGDPQKAPAAVTVGREVEVVPPAASAPVEEASEAGEGAVAASPETTEPDAPEPVELTPEELERLRAEEERQAEADRQRQEVARAREMLAAQAHLPKLSGFVMKKSPNRMAGWQKRFLMVAEYNLFYGKKEVDTNHAAGALKAGMNCVPLMLVNFIQVAPSKDDRQFVVQARDSKHASLREYLFRTKSKRERDIWTAGLNKHKEHLQELCECPFIKLDSV